MSAAETTAGVNSNTPVLELYDNPPPPAAVIVLTDISVRFIQPLPLAVRSDAGSYRFVFAFHFSI